jgi:hypothetical protein
MELDRLQGVVKKMKEDTYDEKGNVRPLSDRQMNYDIGKP